MALGRLIADVTVRAPDGRVLAVVEVKNRVGLTRDIATPFRRNIIAHSNLGAAPYFLLVSQDEGYLWRQRPDLETSAPPDAAFDMASVVTRYLGAQTPGSRLQGIQLQAVVYRWLIDLADDRVSTEAQAIASLSATGFIDAIRGATVELEAAIDSLR